MVPDNHSTSATPLLTALQRCAQMQQAPFYAPGHKRGQGISQPLSELLGAAVFKADLPELPELDNLFAPQAAIRDAQILAADAFGAQQTWFLVNGSTCGVIAAILATCEPGDKLILPRNVHQSAIAGLILSGAVPIFVQPEYDPVLDLAHSITPNAVAAALKQHPDAKAVLMIYPTYYGVCGDVQTITQLAHTQGIPLLVDEAHGAHFAFHPDLPTSALAAGADLAVQSTHKTLSAMTQAAMLHIQGTLVEGDRVRQALQLVQSTSPSYLLLASLDAARAQMATSGNSLLAQTLQLADLARTQISQIPGLSTLQPSQAGSPGFVALDRTRLTVTVSRLGIDGFAADEYLSRFGVTAELPSLQHLTFIISLGNTAADIKRLVQAFVELAREQGIGDRGQGLDVSAQLNRTGEDSIQPAPLRPFTPPSSLLPSPSFPPTPYSPRQAFFAQAETLPISQAVQHISAELVCPYPPGIPVLMPGEIITEEAIAYLQQVLASGGVISGCADPGLGTLRVVRWKAVPPSG